MIFSPPMRRMTQQSDFTENLPKHFENRMLSWKFRGRPVGMASRERPIPDKHSQVVVHKATIDMKETGCPQRKDLQAQLKWN